MGFRAVSATKRKANHRGQQNQKAKRHRQTHLKKINETDQHMPASSSVGLYAKVKSVESDMDWWHDWAPVSEPSIHTFHATEQAL